MNKYTKTYFTVMMVLSIILAVLSSLCALFFIGFVIVTLYIDLFYGTFLILSLILSIFTIIASVKFGKYRKMTDKQLVAHKGGILAWGIVAAIYFIGTLLGFVTVLICAILVNNYINDLQKVISDPEAVEKLNSTTVADTTQSMFKTKLTKQGEQLEQTKQMFENNLISKEEYEALRKKILEI